MYGWGDEVGVGGGMRWVGVGDELGVGGGMRWVGVGG